MIVEKVLVLFAARTEQQYAIRVKRFMKNVTTAIPRRTNVGQRVVGVSHGVVVVLVVLDGEIEWERVV